MSLSFSATLRSRDSGFGIRRRSWHGKPVTRSYCLISVLWEHGWYLNLEVPTASVGYILPGRARGPWTIVSVARQGTRVENGHHLFGYVQVQCPTCRTVRYYWLYVHMGTEGWYAEITDDETSAIMEKIRARPVIETDDSYLRRPSGRASNSPLG